MTPVRESLLSRIDARTKLILLVAFAVLVVLTPREWVPVFGGYVVVVGVVLALGRVRPRTVARGMLIELPFVVSALLMPFIATGPRVDVRGVALSVEGLWGAWGLLAKATLALLAAIAFASTTEPRRVVAALEELHLPRQLTEILAFMLRYLDVIAEEAARMRIARQARGFTAKGPRAWRVLGMGIGALFVRAHARGERIHFAMLARGYHRADAR